MKNYLDKLSTQTSDDDILTTLFGESEKVCPKCGFRKYHRVKKRKCYECGQCGHQIYPLKGTVMESTKLPLWMWIAAIKEFHYCLNGISAVEIASRLKITYKTAWRMANKIRSLMQEENDEQLSGIIEMDETYIGGKKKVKKKGDHGFTNKKTVFGMVQRRGSIKAFSVKNRDKKTILPLIKKHTVSGTIIYTDEHPLYINLSKLGYKHDFVRHNKYKWAKGQVHTNTIEGFWSLLKTSIRGTYKSVSEKFLQRYLHEFAFRYNRRRRQKEIFDDMVYNLIQSSISRKLELRINSFSSGVSLQHQQSDCSKPS